MTGLVDPEVGNVKLGPSLREVHRGGKAVERLPCQSFGVRLPEEVTQARPGH